MTRLRDRRDRLWTTVNVDVVGQDVDYGGGAVLANRRRVDERDWRIVNRPDGHVDRGGRATVQGVGEDVAAIEVRIRREGQAGASARDGIGQDVDCGGAAVLANRRRVDDCDWRMVNRPDGHVDRGGRATVQGVGEDVAAIEVRIRREGQAGAPARDGNCAMTRLRDRHNRLWTTVDVDVVGQDVDCRGAAVLANRRRDDDRDWRMVNRPEGHVDRGR